MTTSSTPDRLKDNLKLFFERLEKCFLHRRWLCLVFFVYKKG
ncbi:hypothetical protein VHA_002789 [Grimontia hollisae CIP 101886]|uniref:Uncharacterized protein n=1 Tax=Grimontia hollisae CIP 101886 TaxID=675812 RepID=D0IAL2_GRIHO|nr:hypothetical protein VHA_002789 [Grimontia hollisae CIP 101886]